LGENKQTKALSSQLKKAQELDSPIIIMINVITGDLVSNLAVKYQSYNAPA
jgi:hypothetical protein